MMTAGWWRCSSFSGAPVVVEVPREAELRRVVRVLHEVMEAHARRMHLVRAFDPLDPILLTHLVPLARIAPLHHLAIPVEIEYSTHGDFCGRFDVLYH